MHLHRRLMWRGILMILLFSSIHAARSAEYEVEGTVRQSITTFNGARLDYTNNFTVYVRDCRWLIKTTETNGNGLEWQREVGSDGGPEIFEANAKQAFISGKGIPVESLDKGVDGHLWLMFASQCYWTNLHSDQVTPVFDWHASVGASPDLKVTAEWELLDGPGSLPREVRYLGRWDETNALYMVTGTNSAGGVLIPSGFVFEERFATPGGMKLRKRVDATVASVRTGCSRKSLLPVRGDAAVVIVDWRLKEPSSGNHIPAYRDPDVAKWPSVEEAKKLIQAESSGAGQSRANPGRQHPEYHRMVVFILMCVFLIGPAAIYFIRQRPRKS
jgi:hypothetical protein